MYRLLGVLRRGVHHADRVEGPWVRPEPAHSPGRRVPLLWLVGLEGERHVPVGPALCLPDHPVHAPGVVEDAGVESVVVPLRGVVGLRDADLLGGLAEELEGAAQPVLLHGRLGPEDPGQRRDAQGGVGVCVPRCVGVEFFVPQLLVGDGGLVVRRHRVVLGEGGEHRLSLPVSG